MKKQVRFMEQPLNTGNNIYRIQCLRQRDVVAHILNSCYLSIVAGGPIPSLFEGAVMVSLIAFKAQF